MRDDRQMLASILKTAQTEQVGIRNLLETSMRPGLRKALQAQLCEYSAIESEAQSLAYQRGWELPEMQPANRLLTEFKIRRKLRRGNSDSKIASMMIQGNTCAMIQGLKELHQYQQQDSGVSALSQRLLDCETANIRQMQAFL